MSLKLRRADEADAEAVARLFRASRALLTFLPDLHTAEEDLSFVRDHLLTRQRVTVAERHGRIAGVMAEADGWITQLYVDPNELGTGLGSALLADAKTRNHHLELWCFAENARARAFYEKHGFVAVGFTDGSGNDEKRPDIRYRWERRLHDKS